MKANESKPTTTFVSRYGSGFCRCLGSVSRFQPAARKLGEQRVCGICTDGEVLTFGACFTKLLTFKWIAYISVSLFTGQCST